MILPKTGDVLDGGFWPEPVRVLTVHAVINATWGRNDQPALREHLQFNYGGNESFWQVAQAIAEVLPEVDKERQLSQGLLYGRRTRVAEAPQQYRLPGV